jgi:hypothetical protein
MANPLAVLRTARTRRLCEKTRRDAIFRLDAIRETSCQVRLLTVAVIISAIFSLDPKVC